MPTYVSVYPPAYNSTYVKSTSSSAGYEPYLATNPALSLTGASVNNSFLSNSSQAEKVNIDLGSAKTVVRLYIENYHSSGKYTELGAVTAYVYGTNSASAFANTTYADTTDLVLLDTLTIAEHVYSDIADPQYFVLASSGAYQYYVVRLAASYFGFGGLGLRRIELQESGGGSGDVVLPGIAAGGAGGGAGALSLGSASVSAAGGGAGALSLGSASASAAGGGAGVLTFNSVTIAGTGETSVLADVGGALSYEVTSGITAWSHVAASVGGTLGYSLTSEIIIDVISVGGELPYSLTSGITAHSQNDTIIAGVLGYSLTSGVEARSHIAVSVGGVLAYELTSGVTAHRNLGVTVGGSLSYEVDSGISAWPSPQADVGGDLPYTLTSGIEASSGDSCAGVLAYVRPTVC